MKQLKLSITTNDNVKLPEGCDVEAMKQQMDKVHADHEEKIKKLTEAISGINKKEAEAIEGELDAKTTKFEEALKQAEEGLMKYGPEGDEAELSRKIDELFDFDKQSHEDLQNAIAAVEQEQLSLNQARMNMGEEKKSVTEPLVQKMDAFHGKCEDSANELKHRLHESQQKRCGEYEAKLEELG